MTPKVGEVYMLDLGYEGKARPIVIMSREDPNSPRALSLFVPLTKETRGSQKSSDFGRLIRHPLRTCTGAEV